MRAVTKPRATCSVGPLRGSRAQVVCHASVLARWCLDARYGCKQEATSLLQEWVRDVGSKAGLAAANTRLSSGALGVPESRLEMEISFASMSEWEDFLSRIPFQEHKAWTQRIQSMVVDGSPKWEVHRCVPLLQMDESNKALSTAVPLVNQKPELQPPTLLMPSTSSSSFDEELLQQLAASSSNISTNSISSSNELILPKTAAAPLSDQSSTSPEEDVILDWKGDPMKLNPGDKLPFKFL